MKLTSKIFFLGVFLTLGACKDEFYDQRPYDSLPVDRAILTEADMTAAANGMYAGLRSVDLYGRTIPLIGDLMADNVYIHVQNSGRYLPQYNYSVNNQNGDIGGTWASGYATILRANNIINAAVPESAIQKQLKGEALAVRALLYFDLVRIFAKPFSTDPNAAGVPIITKFDPTNRPARNKVSEVYDQILKDLAEAYILMTVNKNASYMTKFAARALAAKVYLYKGDYANAQAAALEVVRSGGFLLTTGNGYLDYWKSAVPTANKLETIFEVSSDGVANLGTNSLAYIYDQAGYGDMVVPTEVQALYSNTDTRRQLMKAGTRGGQAILIVNKYTNVSNANDKDDTKVLRYADVLLILAEAYARQGNELEALNTLNLLVQRRDPSFGGYTSSGTQLLEDIISERRKEFAFEGDRFHDLNRLGRVINRTLQFPAAARSILANDYRRVAPIPQVEMDSNPNMVQNDNYPK